MAEDAGVLFVSGRVRGDLTKLDVILGVRGVDQDDAVLGIQPLLDGIEGLNGLARILTDTGHHAVALGLDEDLALITLVAAHLVAEEVVGAQEPLAVPPMFEHGFRHFGRGLASPFTLGRVAALLDELGVHRADVTEHASNEDRLRGASFAIARRLIRLVGRFAEAIQVQAIVPVRSTDQR